MADILEKEVVTSTTNVTLITTSETVIITSPLLKMPFQTARAVIKAWAQLTTGASTTAVIPRIRRGSSVTGTLVGEANSESIKTAAGSTEPFMIMAVDERADQESVSYSLTLEQVGAIGNGTALQAGIEVEFING